MMARSPQAGQIRGSHSQSGSPLELHDGSLPDRKSMSYLTYAKPVEVVVVRSGQDPIVVNLDIPSPEEASGTKWVDSAHPE